ncbi:MAG TPA: hypothetical protein VIP70_08730 [Nitrososphaeraceae archaeon]
MNIKACGQQEEEEEVDIIQLYYIILSIFFKITHPAAPCWFTHVFSATLVKAAGVILHNTELITNSLLHNYR